ncbi:hypothetical protein [Capybara microvirus Cap3_SP_393]|nr:hypothetical protein [Capybara microvirus Cap3_SP_393]
MLIKNNSKTSYCSKKQYININDSYNYLSSFQAYVRTYYDYQYVQSNYGVAYFYTLTFNDLNLNTINYNGISINTHNHKLLHLWIDNVYKILLRKFDCKSRFFITSECGEGKGSRKKGNNPHYHVILYVIPTIENMLPTSKEMLSIVRYCWQGTDLDLTLKQNSYIAKTCKNGILKEGKNLGLIESLNALSYVCKYVSKDIETKEHYDIIKNYYYYKFYNEKLLSCLKCIDNLIYILQKSGLNETYCNEIQLDNINSIDEFELYLFDFVKNNHGSTEFILCNINKLYKDIYNTYRLIHKEYDFLDYIPKTFYPQMMGFKLAKQNIVETCSGTFIKIDNKLCPISKCFFNKLYKTHLRSCPSYSRYNYDGINYLCRTIQNRIDILAAKANLYCNDKNICKLYSMYKLVYEHRLIPISDFNKPLEMLKDYKNYMELESIFSFRRTFGIELNLDNYEKAIMHPQFYPYRSIFTSISNVIEKSEIADKQHKEENFEHKKHVKKLLNSYRYEY